MNRPPADPASAAPADLKSHRAWSNWAKVLAYGVFVALAIASIWFINRRVDAIADDPADHAAQTQGR